MEATANIIRAIKQAPWRQQTQLLAGLSIALLILLVVGGLYLAVASRAGNAGRDLQRLEAHKADLMLQTDRLRKSLADLRSMTRMANRALELGFTPAQPDQIHYVAVPDYPPAVAATPVTTTVSAEAAQASGDNAPASWFQALQQMLGVGVGGG